MIKKNQIMAITKKRLNKTIYFKIQYYIYAIKYFLNIHERSRVFFLKNTLRGIKEIKSPKVKNFTSGLFVA